MPLPKAFVERNLEKVEGATMFGVPIEDLTREELIACVIAGFDAQKQAIAEGSRQREFLIGLRSLMRTG